MEHMKKVKEIKDLYQISQKHNIIDVFWNLLTHVDNILLLDIIDKFGEIEFDEKGNYKIVLKPFDDVELDYTNIFDCMRLENEEKTRELLNSLIQICNIIGWIICKLHQHENFTTLPNDNKKKRK